MMLTVIDVENSVQWKDTGVIDGSPFNPDNYLVSVGFCHINSDMEIFGDDYVFFKHDEFTGDSVASFKVVQAALDKTTVMIGHNIKHDYMWLLESGFEYYGDLYDTMLGEYVLARGVKAPLDLGSCCERRRVAAKKSELISQYWKDKVGFERIPLSIVEEYGRADVQSTAELFIVQQTLFANDRNRGLVKTRDMMNEFCAVLTDMERNGIKCDMDELTTIEAAYLEEQKALLSEAEELIYQAMGDTPINLNSPEQLSMVIYGRKVIDKNRWAEVFNIGVEQRGSALKPKRRPKMKPAEFAQAIKRNTTKLYKTRAEHCSDCNGFGKIHKVKKDGSFYAKANKCKTCSGTGFIYVDLKQSAGFGQFPKTTEDVASGGFATDKTTLSALADEAAIKGDKQAERFLRIIIRLNAIDTYLNSFIGGIRRHAQNDNILHCHFNQAVTSTGRLSSSDP